MKPIRILSSCGRNLHECKTAIVKCVGRSHQDFQHLGQLPVTPPLSLALTSATSSSRPASSTNCLSKRTSGN